LPILCSPAPDSIGFFITPRSSPLPGVVSALRLASPLQKGRPWLSHEPFRTFPCSAASHATSAFLP
jgi:hypothetical protein